MAVPDRHADAGLSPRARARAEFFGTVRQIVAAARAGLGDDTRADAEPIRFRVADGMRHPDVEVLSLDRAQPDGPVAMTVGHMGLTGPMGVLPDHYSDLVVERRRQRDEALARFLDLFNHRAISLFYRAWSKYRLPVRFEEAGAELADPFTRALAALAGVARLDDPAMLAAAGPLARRVRSAGALRRIVSAMFAMPVEVQELRPRRIRIDACDQTRLGSRRLPAGSYTALSRNAVAGEVAWDVAGRFRIRVGPLDWPSFQSFFAADGVRRQLVDAVRFAVGGNVDFDIQLVLRADAVPALQLDPAAPARLSRTGWLLAGPARADRDDAVLPGTRPLG